MKANATSRARSLTTLGILVGVVSAATIVVACDMPRVTASVATALIAASDGHDAAVPILGSGPEPLCAVYRASAAAQLGIALGEGRLQVRAALSQLDVVYLEGLGAGLFANLNTQDDYLAFLAALR